MYPPEARSWLYPSRFLRLEVRFPGFLEIYSRPYRAKNSASTFLLPKKKNIWWRASIWVGPDSHGPGAAKPREGWSAMLRSVATHRNAAVMPCASVSAAIFWHWRRIPGREERPLRRAHTAAAESLCTTSLQRRVRRDRAAQRIARTSAPASFSLMCACRARDSGGYAQRTATCQSAGSTLAVNAAERSDAVLHGSSGASGVRKVRRGRAHS